MVAPATPEQHPRRMQHSMHESGSPYPEDFHALYDPGFRAAHRLPPEEAAPAVTEGHRKMERDVGNLDVQYDATTRLPNLVVSRSPTARLSTRGAGSPQSAVEEFIQSRGDLWNLSTEDRSTVQVVSVSQPGRAAAREGGDAEESTRKKPRAAAKPAFGIGGLQTVNLIQRVDDTEVFNSDVTVAVNADNEVLSVSGQFFPGAGEAATRARTRGGGAGFVPEKEAIARAAFDLTNFDYPADEFARAEAPADAGPYSVYEHRAAADSGRPEFERPTRVKDVMFPLGDGQFVPGYYMELWIKGFPAFSYVVDAVDSPDVLYRKNLTSLATFKYRVHNTGDAIFRPHDGPAPGSPHPTGKPNGFQAKPVPEKLIPVESLLPGDPWL
ncbi:MAG TPA: hypothetical protein VFQ76_19770, partial [Longimicrobiaceae bacterium]|nr:hypothetical protein [Longimicrobiaceae bacterium]